MQGFFGSHRNPECHCSFEHKRTLHITHAMQKLRVTFLYAKKSKRLGSVVLRCDQASKNLSSYDPSLSVQTSSIEEFNKKAGVVVVSKSCFRLPDIKEFLKDIKRTGSVVLFDLIDGHVSLSERYSEYADGYICSSLSEYNSRIRTQENVFFVNHLIDDRLTPRGRRNDLPRIGYAGDPTNAKHLNLDLIDVLDTTTLKNRRDLQNLNEFLSEHSFHYSIRQINERDGFKPGLKLFMASYFDSAFIGSLSDVETTLWLGPNYPYLSQNSNQKQVVEVIHYALETFHTTVYDDALMDLSKLRQSFCPVKVTADLHLAVTSFGRL
jgi:hypothetical protein